MSGHLWLGPLAIQHEYRDRSGGLRGSAIRCPMCGAELIVSFGYVIPPDATYEYSDDGRRCVCVLSFGIGDMSAYQIDCEGCGWFAADYSHPLAWDADDEDGA